VLLGLGGDPGTTSYSIANGQQVAQQIWNAYFAPNYGFDGIHFDIEDPPGGTADDLVAIATFFYNNGKMVNFSPYGSGYTAAPGNSNGQDVVTAAIRQIASSSKPQIISLINVQFYPTINYLPYANNNWPTVYQQISTDLDQWNQVTSSNVPVLFGFSTCNGDTATTLANTLGYNTHTTVSGIMVWTGDCGISNSVDYQMYNIVHSWYA